MFGLSHILHRCVHGKSTWWTKVGLFICNFFGRLYCIFVSYIECVDRSTWDTSVWLYILCHRFRHTISHKLDLQSVYKHVLPGSGQPEVTTLHSDVGATVDYIFYTPKRVSPSDPKGAGTRNDAGHATVLNEFAPAHDCFFLSEGLKLLGCLSLPSEDVLWSINGLPSHIFPSDHLSLLAKFQLLVDAVWWEGLRTPEIKLISSLMMLPLLCVHLVSTSGLNLAHHCLFLHWARGERFTLKEPEKESMLLFNYLHVFCCRFF